MYGSCVGLVVVEALPSTSVQNRIPGGEFSYLIAKTNRAIKSELLQSCNISSSGIFNQPRLLLFVAFAVVESGIECRDCDGLSPQGLELACGLGVV